MATTLGYSVIEEKTNINNESSSGNIHEYRRKNKTIKKRDPNESSNNKVETMMKHLNLSNSGGDDDVEGLADFNPPVNPISSVVDRTKNSVSNIENFQNTEEGINNIDENDDNEVSQEGFQEANGTYAQQYYKQFVPYYSNASNIKEGASSNPEIMEKLNYLVNLIENNNDEKVNSITEELVLYCFLGVFIIFIVDSFAKVGKYVR
jgi:hypothetical protein